MTPGFESRASIVLGKFSPRSFGRHENPHAPPARGPQVGILEDACRHTLLLSTRATRGRNTAGRAGSRGASYRAGRYLIEGEVVDEHGPARGVSANRPPGAAHTSPVD